MIIETELIKEQCSKISQAVNRGTDSEQVGNINITEVLELYSFDRMLYINVTNREYYVRVKINIDSDETLHATVNAALFLKLITQVTTPDVELSIKGQSLLIKANGTYRLPLIYAGDRLLELPEITVNNVTCSMTIPSSTLLSILKYNSREIGKKVVAKPVQRMYYIDEKGAITFTSSACVNSFTLDRPVRMLLNNKIVKLFKLFTDECVEFNLGHDLAVGDILQTKVSFKSEDVELTAILSCDDTLLNSVPVSSIRTMAENPYPYTATLSRDGMLQAINRLSLFTQSLDSEAYFEFSADKLTIYSADKENSESILYMGNALNLVQPITVMLSFLDVKSTLETSSDAFMLFSFGGDEERAVIISKDNIKNIIPKMVLSR